MITMSDMQDLSVRSGKWRNPKVRSIHWRDATVGIVGLGNIGSQVAAMCSALGMNVIYTSRTPKDVPYGHRTLEQLLGEADCVVLTCPLNAETTGLMNAERFAMMKDGSILVNVSRGPVVVEDDLVKALESGKGE
jgi:glyoxylate reductase